MRSKEEINNEWNKATSDCFGHKLGNVSAVKGEIIFELLLNIRELLKPEDGKKRMTREEWEKLFS